MVKTLMDMPNEIWLIVTDFMDSPELARLSRACEKARAIAEAPLYRQCDGEKLISWSLVFRNRFKTLKKLFRYQKELGGREYSIEGIPSLMEAALRLRGPAVNLLLDNGVVITKKTILTLLSEGQQGLIIDTFNNIGSRKGYHKLIKMMVHCIFDLTDTEVEHRSSPPRQSILEETFTAACLDRSDVTKSLLWIIPRSERQYRSYLILIFGINSQSLDRGQKEKGVRSLLAHGADPRSGYKEEPLVIAARLGYSEIVLMLLQQRKFNPRLNDHRRAWRVAKSKGHHAVQQVIYPELRVSQRQLEWCSSERKLQIGHT